MFVVFLCILYLFLSELCVVVVLFSFFFFFKQKTAYEMRISDWSSDVCSSDLPLAAKIADSAADSGRDNLHTRIEPERYQRQVRLFHEIVPFKQLGIVYEDSEAGRTYAAVSAVEQVVRELGFAIQSCHAQSSSISTEAAIDNALKCSPPLPANNVTTGNIT